MVNTMLKKLFLSLNVRSTVRRDVQSNGVYFTAFENIHIKSLRSHVKRVGYGSDFGIP